MKQKLLFVLLILCIKTNASELTDTIFSIDTVNINNSKFAIFASYNKNNCKKEIEGSTTLQVTLYDDKKRKILTYTQYIPIWLNTFDLIGFIDYDLHRQFMD
jgi:hypothetical protein